MESVLASSLLLILLVLLLLQSLVAFRLPESTPMRPLSQNIAPAAASAHSQHQQRPKEPSSGIRYCRSSTTSSRQEYLCKKVATAVVGSASVFGLWDASIANAGSSGGVGVGRSSPLLVAAVKASSLAEAQAAAKNVRTAVQGVKDMQKAANEGDWATVR